VGWHARVLWLGSPARHPATSICLLGLRANTTIQHVICTQLCIYEIFLMMCLGEGDGRCRCNGVRTNPLYGPYPACLGTLPVCKLWLFEGLMVYPETSLTSSWLPSVILLIVGPVMALPSWGYRIPVGDFPNPGSFFFTGHHSVSRPLHFFMGYYACSWLLLLTAGMRDRRVTLLDSERGLRHGRLLMSSGLYITR